MAPQTLLVAFAVQPLKNLQFAALQFIQEAQLGLPEQVMPTLAIIENECVANFLIVISTAARAQDGATPGHACLT